MRLAASQHPLYDRIDRLLLTVNNPGCYAGNEFNIIRKEGNALRLRYGLAHPDRYEAGFENPELAVLYDLLNRQPDVGAERVFLPDHDMERTLAAAGLPLHTLESRTPLRELDVVHFCVRNAATGLNIPAMLEGGGIAPLAADRGEDTPLVLVSGPPAFAPEPLADLTDLFLIGETEDVAEALVEKWRTFAASGLDRAETILELARTLDGAYAPAFYRVEPDGRGGLNPPVPTRPGLPEQIRAARVADFETGPIPLRPLVAGVRSAGDSMHLEIMRGFDPAPEGAATGAGGGVALPPARPRSTRRLLEALEAQFTATGHEGIVLAAPCPAAYPDLSGLIAGIRARFRGLRVHLRIPGLRLDEQMRLLDPAEEPIPGPAGAEARGYLTPVETSPAFTRLAAGREDREELLDVARCAYRQGVGALEMQAVIGVPGENEDDVVSIGALARDLSAARRAVDQRFGRMELRCASWIPSPHSRFEREAIPTEDDFQQKLGLIRKGLGRRRDVRVRVEPAGLAHLETLLSRADRRLGRALATVARDGGRIHTGRPAPDVSSLAYRLLDAAGLDANLLFNPGRELGERPPWSHVGIGD